MRADDAHRQQPSEICIQGADGPSVVQHTISNEQQSLHRQSEQRVICGLGQKVPKRGYEGYFVLAGHQSMDRRSDPLARSRLAPGADIIHSQLGTVR